MQVSATPKLLRWAPDAGLPPSPASSDGAEWDSPSSALAFLNSQLLAHGFARPPGLAQPLSRLTPDELEPVMKCLRDLLEQRITDMERTEELTARFRSLSHDHERLIGMHKTARDQVAQAQRECELAKSKHATTTSAFVELQATQKQTAFNLQRAQSALVFARQTAQNEIKRKDKEIERIQDRWAKLANDQPKTGTAIGMRCTNLVAENGPAPKGPSILESSLTQLKTDHDRLTSQNESFRAVLIALATKLSALSQRDSPAPTGRPQRAITDLTLFPPSEEPWKDDTENARTALQDLLRGVESVVERLSREAVGGAGSESGEAMTKREQELKERLAAEVDSLKAELEQSRQALTEQMNGALDAFAMNQRLLRGQPRASVESSSETQSLTAEQQRELEERERRIEEGNEQLTAAAIQLGKERNALAAAQLELEEEKRSWKLQQMIDELPDTPELRATPQARPGAAPIPAPMFLAPPEHKQQKARSPKKAKATVRLSPTKKSPRRVPSHTIVMRAPLFTSDIAEEDEDLDSIPASSSIITSSSSSTTNPFDQILAQSAQAAQSLNRLTLSPEKKKAADLAPFPTTEAASAPPAATLPVSTPPLSPIRTLTSSNPPLTPVSLSAAQARMKKNPYAPAVPSPLSRILRMADSPPFGASVSPESGGESSSSGSTISAPRWGLAKLIEGDEEEEDAALVPVPLVTLAEELGLDNGEEFTQTRRSPTKRLANRSTSPRRMKDKGKAKLLGTPPRSTAPTSLLRVREKENAVPSSTVGTGPFAPAPSGAGANAARVSAASKITIGARVVGGRPTTSSSHIMKGGKVPVKPSNTTGARSLRDHVRSRYGQMPSSANLPRGD